MALSGEDFTTYQSSLRPLPSVWPDSFLLHFKSVILYTLAPMVVYFSCILIHTQLQAIIASLCPWLFFYRPTNPIPSSEVMLSRSVIIPSALPWTSSNCLFLKCSAQTGHCVSAEIFPTPGDVFHVPLFSYPSKTLLFSKQLERD